MLCQYEFELTPCQAQDLIWNRFISTHSEPGRNIPGDLHQEHLNRVCKDCIQELGSNKTERAITRVEKLWEHYCWRTSMRKIEWEI